MTCFHRMIDARRSGACLLLTGAVVLLFASRTVAQDVKRGIGGGGIELANAANARWYYNWGNTPPAEVTSGAFSGEWVPMIWSANSGSIQGKIDTILGYASNLGVDHVLGFNEPDRAEQANMTVADSIALWDIMDDQFSSAGIKLVSPAADQDWMDDFMNQANALNLTVDAVALHWYGTPNINNPTATANGFLSRVDSLYSRYNKPIWITEFAGMDWGVNDITSEQLIAFNEAFLAVVVPGLESRSYVERYAWWQFGRRDVPGEENDTLLIQESEGLWSPTGIGDQYVPSYREGEQHNLSGTNPGETNYYLRGGNLVNASGPSVTVASVDAVDGNSDFGGDADWRIENGVLRVRNSAVLRKTGASKVTVSGSTVSNSGELQIVSGTLTLDKNAQLVGPGSVDLATGATLALGAALDRSGIVISQPIELLGGAIQSNQTVDGAHTINGPLTVRETSTFSGDGTVFVNGPLQAPADGVGGGIVKQGTGSLVLTGSNSFRGQVSIHGGTLALGAGASAAASSGFAIEAGARLDVSDLTTGLLLADTQILTNKAGGRVQGDVVAGSGASVSASGVFAGNLSAQSGSTVSVGGENSSTAQPQTIFLTPPKGNLGSNSDVRVRSGSNANTNQNDTVALGIGSISSTDAFRSLLTFDLSSTGITDPNFIQSVALTMTLTAPNGAQVNTPSPPTLELLTIGPYNSDTATFNNTPFNSANLISTTTGPNFTQYTAGATIGWADSNSGPFAEAIKNAIGGSLHLGARAASIPGTRSFYFIEHSETATAGAAPTLAITYAAQTTGYAIGSAVIEGDLTLDSGSGLEIDLLNTTSFDQLAVSGTAMLDGLLSVSMLDPSQLSVNDTFTILTAANIVNNLTLGGPSGGMFNLSASTPTALVLTFVGDISLPGDFNGDQVVDAADYSVWRDNLGSTEGTLLNSNGTGGVIDQADYDLWKANFGASSASAALTAAVPEPVSAGLALLATIAASVFRRRS